MTRYADDAWRINADAWCINADDAWRINADAWCINADDACDDLI